MKLGKHGANEATSAAGLPGLEWNSGCSLGDLDCVSKAASESKPGSLKFKAGLLSKQGRVSEW